MEDGVRRRDLEPLAPATQQPKPCGRWVARRPGDVCSATTEAERRPQDVRWDVCSATTEAERRPQDVRWDVCSAPTEAKRRPWTHGRLPRNNRSLAEDGLQDVRGTSVLQRPERSGDLGPLGTMSPLLKLKRAKP
jgi:hypothetical protein